MQKLNIEKSNISSLSQTLQCYCDGRSTCSLGGSVCKNELSGFLMLLSFSKCSISAFTEPIYQSTYM